jgi:NAD(P)H-hydrate epimerase
MVTSDFQSLPELVDWADAVVIGPGLGRDAWGQRLLSSLIKLRDEMTKPLIIDADALTLLSTTSINKPDLSNCIVTPHSGEAARLLNQTSMTIDKNRYKSAIALADKLGTLVVLKGAGTIVQAGTKAWVCEDGNPGMATAGMGDVLSGVIGALVVNGLPFESAVRYAVCIHSRAADIVATEKGPKGLLASDLFDPLRRLVNF